MLKRIKMVPKPYVERVWISEGLQYFYAKEIKIGDRDF